VRRYLYIFLFFIVLIAPFVVRMAVARRGEAAPVMTGAGPALELVVVTPHNQDIRRAFERAFSDWHVREHGQAVRIVYLTPGGTNDIVRYISDIYGAQGYRGAGTMPQADRINISIDLVWGGGDTTFERELKPFLQPANLEPRVLRDAFPTADLNGVPLYEASKDAAAPRWVGVVLSSFGIVYNPSLYETLGLPAPTQWSDLAHPRLSGFVALADPTRSGSAAVTYMVALQRAMADEEEALLAAAGDRDLDQLKRQPEYEQALARGWKNGMRTLLLMAANARYFTDSATQVPNDVGNGDAAAGVAIDFYGRVFQQAIGTDRIRYVAPRGATAISPDPIAVLHGVRGQREVLANRFIEYLLTPDGQRLWNIEGAHTPYLERSLRRLPIRRDVYRDRTGWADDTDPFEEAAGFNVRGDWMRLFSDTRPIWAAAWIDSRRVLKDAYATILRVEDPALRERLLFELSDLPIEMSDVAQQLAQRKVLEESDADWRLWMTQQRVGWARTFRAHYRAVAAKAR
jgi:iron(III) transport system substrate-binding protein